jgi:hypothetical protein
VTRWLVVIALAACGHAPASRISADDAIFYVKTNVADAAVYVDGHYIGTSRYVGKGIAVNPGRHRLELRHDDYFSRYVQLELKRAERKNLDLTLAPILP